MPEEAVQGNLYQFKPLRVFADTTVAVVVQTTDIDGLTVTSPDTKLPDPPKQSDISTPDQIVIPTPQ
jgi:hypothetical protein